MVNIRTRLTILCAGLLAGLMLACSSGIVADAGGAPGDPRATNTQAAAAPGNFDDCAGLLDLEDVQAASGREDVTITEENVNSGGQDPNGSSIKTMCIHEFVTPEIFVGGPAQLRVSGPTITFTGILFDSEQSAGAHYRFSLENVKRMKDAVTSEVEITEGPVGRDSYQLVANAEGIGTIIGFLSGPYVLQLHTTKPDGWAPLVGPQSLQDLAGTVQERLTSR